MFAFGACLLHTDVSRVCLPLEFVYFILRYPGFVCFWSLSTSYRCSEVNLCGWHDIKIQLLLLLHTEVSRVCLFLEFVYFIPLF